MYIYNKAQILEHAKKELELAGFSNTEYEKAVLNLLETCDKTTGGTSVLMETMILNIARLLRGLPITELTGDEDELDTDIEGIKFNKRYIYLKQVDDTWKDYCATRFVKTPLTKYYSSLSSVKENITYPYYPDPIDVKEEE